MIENTLTEPVPVDGNKLTVPLGRRAVRGAVVLSGATYLSLIVGIAARKILAILLSPADVGVYQTALSFAEIAFSFASFSFTSAIINVRENLIEEPLEHLNENVFYLTVFVNGITAALAMTVGLLSLSKAHGVIIMALIGVYSVQRFLSALDTFYTQVLERELSYTRISTVTLIVNIVLHAGAVSFALLGGGAWAVPIATLISTALSLGLDRKYAHAAGVHALHKKWHTYYNKKTVRWLWKFGIQVLFNRLFEAWLFRVDNMLVVFFFGSALLGFYSQAFTIAQLPAIALAPIVGRVSIATYAGIQHDSSRLEDAFYLTNFFLVRLLVPIAVTVLLTSSDLVRLFLSSKWLSAAPAVVALIGFLITIPLFENAKMILGSKLLLKEISIVRGSQLALLVVLILLIGVHGIVYVGVSVSVVSLLGYAAILLIVRRVLTIHMVSLFLLPVLIGTIVFFLEYFAIAPVLGRAITVAGTVVGSFIRILIFSLITFLLTLGIEYLLYPHKFTEKIQRIRNSFRPPPAAL